MNSSCSCLFLNRGSKPSVLDKFTPSIFFVLFIKSDKLISGSSFANIEAPIAIYNCASFGNTIFSSLKLSTFLNAVLSSDKKYRGPPKKATFPRIGLPHASPLIV